MKKLLILFAVILLPITVNGAETKNVYIKLEFNGAWKEGCSHSNPVGYTHLCQKYGMYEEDGTFAQLSCIDPDMPNPQYLNQLTTYQYGSDAFANGLIAMANYAKQNPSKVGKQSQADAFRLYTVRVSLVQGNVLGSNVVNSLKTTTGTGGVTEMLNVGLCAARNENCSGIDLNKYVPNGGGSSSTSTTNFEINKSNQETSTSKKSFTVIATVNVKVNDDESKANPQSCSAEGYSCEIYQRDLDSNGSFKVKVTGTIGKGSSAQVKISFSGSNSSSSNDDGMITALNLYTCEGTKDICSPTQGLGDSSQKYQRFIELISTDTESPEEKVEKNIYISIPGLCDDPNISQEDTLENGCCSKVDVTQLKEDSEEEDKYIKQCGPIVHVENNCGKSSCDEDDSSYLDFSHSYVKRRNLKYLMLDLDQNGMSAVSEEDISKGWIDKEGINNYCAIFTTSKTDIFTPGTATSVSGQFFVFDQYTSTNYNNTNTYFRQPYIVERVKSAFFFDYKSWYSSYMSAIEKEEAAYETWQSAIKTVKNLYNAYYNANKDANDYSTYLNNGTAASGCGKYKKTSWVFDYNTCKATYDSKKADSDYKYSEWQSALEYEKTTQNAYKAAVKTRTGLQGDRNKCMNESASLASNLETNIQENTPEVSFTYKQTSIKSGETSTTVEMESNTESTKYWPNTTSSDTTATNYLGQQGSGLNTSTATSGISDYTKNISRTGVYLADDYGNTGTYTLGMSAYDNCSDECSIYKYTNLSFDSVQGTTNATDPYGKISTSNETISKIYFYRPQTSYYALMNSGEYKTLNYQSNTSYKDINGLEIGYVYNIELTAYKGEYDTSFTIDNLGYKNSKGEYPIEKIINAYMEENNLTEFTSKCNYCNMEMAFKRNCESCDPSDPEYQELVPQFYYRSISLSDVTPNDRDTETNWTDDKGKAAAAIIEQGSLSASLTTNPLDNNTYLALADNLNQENDKTKTTTYLADSSSTARYDIYDDYTKTYLEYEVTLTPDDLKTIKRNTSRSTFNYSEMNLCKGNSYQETVSKSDAIQYCFECNSDMKECKSTFINAFFEQDTTNNTRNTKWKYYVNGSFCTGTISSCIKDLEYTEDGKYPDPLFVRQYLERYKNWP